MIKGLRFDFEHNDIVLKSNGQFADTYIDSQCCALVSLSQICRLTKPEVGAQLATRLYNRRTVSTASAVASAKRMVEKDGGRNVYISVDENSDLKFEADYGN